MMKYLILTLFLSCAQHTKLTPKAKKILFHNFLTTAQLRPFEKVGVVHCSTDEKFRFHTTPFQECIKQLKNKAAAMDGSLILSDDIKDLTLGRGLTTGHCTKCIAMKGTVYKRKSL